MQFSAWKRNICEWNCGKRRNMDCFCFRSALRAEPLRTFTHHRRRPAMRLRSNEFCPIHKSLSCCGRETLPNPRLVRLGVQRVEDPHHPRGHRELRSPAEMPKIDEPEGPRTRRHLRDLPRRVHRLRYRPRSQESKRNGRSLEGRSSRQYPSNTLVVQFGQRVNADGRLTADHRFDFVKCSLVVILRLHCPFTLRVMLMQ